jgi:hypothetical protein
MGMACSTHGREKICIQILEENMKERDSFENLSIEGRIMEIVSLRYKM